MRKIQVQAHRGASGYAPENTLPAFQMAVDMNADGIECDIHFSKDGHFIVCHDETVDRTSNGTGIISEMTLDEIKALDFGKK
ncbi:MAG: glycerophosphodiester phosphodiesterase, partial [Clostridia bacterium]|nr:glycerophosphodiester phosphodiesterase [Clostridia bacterium]